MPAYRILSHLLPLSLLATAGSPLLSASPAGLPLLPLLEDHCFDCHDGATKKGKLDLENLPQDFSSPATMAVWEKVHDRLAAGEMPPKKKDAPPAGEKQSFLDSLFQSLATADKKRSSAEGRTTMRRLNRDEYENTLRDLLSAPWLAVKEILPEDGEAHRFNKSGSALDISHVQMARYMQAADEALRAVIATGPGKPASETVRYYAREQARMRDKIFYSQFNNSPYRATFPLLGTEAQPDVISEKIPVSVGNSDPATRELEALGVTASSYEPIQPRFDKFTARHNATYKLRLMAQTFTAEAIMEKNGTIQPSREKTFAGQRDEPVSLYAIAARTQRKIAAFDVTPEAEPHEIEVLLRNGETIGPDAARLFRSRPPGSFYNPLATPKGVPGVAFRWLEVEGPIFDQWPSYGHKLLFGDLPINPPGKAKTEGIVHSENPAADARRLLENFVPKAYRRPASPSEIDRFLPIVQSAIASGSTFSDAMIAGYTTVLCSPGFLVLEEPVGKLDGHSLASRLSYFLWNSPPDKTLLDLAASGKLTDPATLRAQTDRLLADPRADLFLNSFLDSWLDLRHINASSPDSTLYPDYYLDDLLTESSLDETRLFFTELVRKNLPARNLISSDFTFANERLADHYGIPGVEGVAMRKISIPQDSPRGGLTTQASILKITANGTTTSPVLRGNWILERILGQTTPPPPPGTPAVEPDIRGAKTIRQQLDKHREDPSCNTCHSKIDPPGFALESFDIFGGWRDQYRALGGNKKQAAKGFGKNGQPFAFHNGLPVDPTGELADGSKFTDIRSFKKLLLEDERAIAKNIANQFITYATGTPVRFGNRPDLEKILNNSQKSGYGIRTIIHEIIQSPVFQKK